MGAKAFRVGRGAVVLALVLVKLLALDWRGLPLAVPDIF